MSDVFDVIMAAYPSTEPAQRDFDALMWLEAPGSAVQTARSKRAGSIGPHRRRTAPAAIAQHAPVVPGDRGRDLPVAEHRQVSGVLAVPQARSLHMQPGRHPGQAAGTPRGVTAGLTPGGDVVRPERETLRNSLLSCGWTFAVRCRRVIGKREVNTAALAPGSGSTSYPSR